MRVAVNTFLDGTCQERSLVQALLLPSIFLFACTGQKRGRKCFNTWVVTFLHKLKTFNEKEDVFSFPYAVPVINLKKNYCHADHASYNTPGLWLTQSRRFAWLPGFLANDRASLVCDVTVPVYSVTTQSRLCGRGVAREHYVTAYYLSYDKATN